MALRVEITEEAEADSKGILEWLISEHAGETGMRWFQRLDKAIASLSLMPERCPLAPENADFPFEVRHLLYGHKPHIYRVIFTIAGDVVYVMRIRHGRRMHLAPQ
jgi:plasmid stabilization system protein ParE